MGNQDRKAGKKKFKHKLLLSGEHETAFRFYIEKLCKHANVNLEIVFAPHIGTTPDKVAKSIVEHIASHPKENYFAKWVVFDRDDHPKDKFDNAINTAKANNIKIAYSNQSYELWLLLHFAPQTGWIHRDDIKKRLSKELGESYEKGDDCVYEKVFHNQKDAIDRAVKLLDRFYRDNGDKYIPYDDNPSTSIVELIISLFDSNGSTYRKPEASFNS